MHFNFINRHSVKGGEICSLFNSNKICNFEKKILFSFNIIVADKLPCPLRGPLNRRYKQWHAIEKIHFSTFRLWSKKRVHYILFLEEKRKRKRNLDVIEVIDQN